MSPNKYQVKSTKENIECYKNLIDLIENDSFIKQNITDLRNNKLRGELTKWSVDLGNNWTYEITHSLRS